MKTVIECTLGATEQTVGGITYSFDRDTHGRFVNEVNSVLHRSIFLNVQHYREVPLDPPPPEDEQEIPAFLPGQGGSGEGDGSGEENPSTPADADQGNAEPNQQPEQAPVAPAAKKATSKSK